MYKLNTAFSILELLIVIAIISILAAISYPSYQQHIAQVNRRRATIALLSFAGKLEETHAITGTYQNVQLSKINTGSINKQLPYQFKLLYATKTKFQLSATPNSIQQKLDPKCTAITITSDGQRGDQTDCWR